MQLVRTISLEMSELKVRIKQLEESEKGKGSQEEMEIGDPVQSPASATRKKRKRAISSANT